VYELPFFKNQAGFVGRAFGGWQVSGIATLATGLPLTVTTANGEDPAGLGFIGPSASGARPDAVSNPLLVSGLRTRLKFFDTSAFKDVPAGVNRVGNSPRGVVRGPGYGRWDMTLGKKFKIRETMSLQFRAEAYNMLNHTNFDTVNTSLGSTLFGQVTGTRDARTIQFGLKLNY